METFSKLHPPSAVRIKAKIVECNEKTGLPAGTAVYSPKNDIQSKKFCVDPQLTSFDVLYSVIGQAFALNEEFQMSYLNRETRTVPDEYLTILNDFDLDAAFIYSSHPYLSLNIIVSSDFMFKFDEEQKVNEQSINVEDWDVISNLDLKPMSPLAKTKLKTTLGADSSIDTGAGRSLIALWSNTAADKAVSVFQKVIHGLSRSNSTTANDQTKSNKHRFNSATSNISHESSSQLNSAKPFDLSQIEKLKPAIGDTEYRNFIDSDGRIIILSDLKQRIFEGGCEPSRRKELWPILLDIFPFSQQTMSTQQRNEFIKQKSIEYASLKSSLWFNVNKHLLKKKQTNLAESELTILANKIQKDVWRTDRCQRFFAGDSNKNVEALFNILLTYSLANGGFYAQGMSDLLSPLYYVLRDESLSFVCFTSVMKRCSTNFDINSDAICSKIELLTCLICKYDPVFWDYLREQSADQLLFVYRWLLIDCKREFPFQDSLRMFEIMWSTIDSSSYSSSSSSAAAAAACSNQSNENFNTSGNFLNNFYSRSSSNASSINLRLFKSYLSRQNALSFHTLSGGDEASASSNCVEDELISDDQNGSILSNDNKSSSTPNSKPANHGNSNDITNSSSNNYLCEFCSAEKSTKLKKKTNQSQAMSSDFSSSVDSDSTESSLDEDCLETLAKKHNRTKWKQNSRFHASRRCNEIKKKRTRYLSLNVNHHAISHELKTKLNELKKEKCLNDMKFKVNKSLARSLSASCIESMAAAAEEEPVTKKSSVSYKNLSKTRKSAITIAAADNLGILIKPVVSSPATKFSTSESGTLKYSQNNILVSSNLSSHHVKESASETESVPSAPVLQMKKRIKQKSKHTENLNNRSEMRCKCSTISSCYNDSHDDCSLGHKKIQSTSTKASKNSSSGIGVSSSASSSNSSKCSTPHPLLPSATAIPADDKHTSAQTSSFDDDEEEELIFALSKQDNPFLLFICFAIFVEHRDHIMNMRMDANDIACYFDKMTRKHNLKSVLGRARYLYTKIYLSKTNAFNYLQQLNEIPLISP